MVPSTGHCWYCDMAISYWVVNSDGNVYANMIYNTRSTYRQTNILPYSAIIQVVLASCQKSSPAAIGDAREASEDIPMAPFNILSRATCDPSPRYVGNQTHTNHHRDCTVLRITFIYLHINPFSVP